MSRKRICATPLVPDHDTKPPAVRDSLRKKQSIREEAPWVASTEVVRHPWASAAQDPYSQEVPDLCQHPLAARSVGCYSQKRGTLRFRVPRWGKSRRRIAAIVVLSAAKDFRCPLAAEILRCTQMMNFEGSAIAPTRHHKHLCCFGLRTAYRKFPFLPYHFSSPGRLHNRASADWPAAGHHARYGEYPVDNAGGPTESSKSVESAKIEQFAQLLATCQRQVFLYAMRLLHSAADAEEVLQETNLVLWRKFDQYQPGTEFGRWACGIAHYEVLKLREKKPREERLFSDQFIDMLATRTQRSTAMLDARRDALAALPRQAERGRSANWSPSATSPGAAPAVWRKAWGGACREPVKHCIAFV